MGPFLAAPALADEAGSPSALAEAELELPALEVPAGGGSLEAAVGVPAQVSVPALETELATVDEGTFLLLAGAALATLLIGVASIALSRGYAGEVPPEIALNSVESGQAILLDVRSSKEKREDGSPRVKASTRGQTTLVAVPFLRSLGGDEFEIDPGFVEAVLGSRAMDLNGSIIVVDRWGRPPAVALSPRPRLLSSHCMLNGEFDRTTPQLKGTRLSVSGTPSSSCALNEGLRKALVPPAISAQAFSVLLFSSDAITLAQCKPSLCCAALPCSSGAKEIGVAAAKALTAAGVSNVAVLKGGSDAWKVGWPQYPASNRSAELSSLLP